MKLKKRPIAIALAFLTLCLALAGCTAGPRPGSSTASDAGSSVPPTPAAIWKEAVAAMEPLTDLDLSLALATTTEMDGSTIAVNMGGDLKIKGLADTADGTLPKDAEFLCSFRQSAMGEETKISLYGAEETMFMDLNGVKLKYPLSLDEVQGSDSSVPDLPEFSVPEIDNEKQEKIAKAMEDILSENATATEKDGKTQINLTITPEQLQDMMGLLTTEGGQFPGLSDNPLSESLQFSDITMAVTLNEKRYFEKFEMKLSGMMTVADEEKAAAGVPATAHVTLAVEFHDLGQPVTIAPPADLEEYMDIEEYYTQFPDYGEYSSWAA